MNRNLKRMLLAFFMSASSFTATVFWFNSGKQIAENSDREPVASLSESLNDVQRKPVQRVIWESVSKNDSLFAGEAIRTASDADAKILLVKSGTLIHLEADSLIVLEENAKGISLDFLEGNISVAAAEGAADGDLTLKAGAGEINLKNADVSLSKQQSGEVNMAVYKGQAELQQGQQKIVLDKEKTATMSDKGLELDKDRLQILWPRAGESVLLNLSKGEKLDVKFKPLPAGYKVSAEWGPSRNKLSPLELSAAGESGKISFDGKSGKWFLKLTGTSDNPDQPQLASLVISVDVGAQTAPSPMEPTAQDPVVTEGGAPVAFRWMNRHQYESQILEVASDAKFKNIVSKKVFNDATMSHTEPLAEGVYYWRVTGFLKAQGKTQPLVSTITRFSVQATWKMDPPALTAPADQQRLAFSDVQRDGVRLKWQAPSGVKRFKVLVQGKDGKTIAERELEATVIKLAGLKPGHYQWTVSSLNTEDHSARPSQTYHFDVEDLAKMEWNDSAAVYEYPSSQPSLRVQWKPVAEAAGYRYYVKPVDSDTVPAWRQTQEVFFEAALPRDGEYVTAVEAVDANGQPLAQSAARTMGIKQRMLLPAPRWAKGTPETLEADGNGDLSFSWEEVPGADHYIMNVETELGKPVSEKNISRTTASLNGLHPGVYKIRLRSVDSLQRPGTSNKARPMTVPATSGITAPKFKKMKVK
jgi:hypothetical protein